MDSESDKKIKSLFDSPHIQTVPGYHFYQSPDSCYRPGKTNWKDVDFWSIEFVTYIVVVSYD